VDRDYSSRTDVDCPHWIRRSLLFHERTHPRAMTESNFNLVHLLASENVDASTENPELLTYPSREMSGSG
jgi:hypothetical protein